MPRGADPRDKPRNVVAPEGMMGEDDPSGTCPAMMSFRGSHLVNLRLPQGTVWMLETLAEAKGRQQLYESQSPQLLRSLREVALVQSAESSNRIEGVTVDQHRLRPLVLGHAKPVDRPEEEIVGYRKALHDIHTNGVNLPLNAATCLHLHGLAQGGTTGDAGVWKARANDIIELRPDGTRVVRFKPVEPQAVPAAMGELFLAYGHVVEQRQVTPLIALGALVLDFLCIHPFRDGNGRVARLLALLGLYHQGFHVGRYVSLERVIEQTKEDYYATLKASSANWHQGTHDVLPWCGYFLSTLRSAYREFEERASHARAPRGSKTQLVEAALAAMRGPFGIADVERACPSVGRDLVRRVMNRWRTEGKLKTLSRGRDARWLRVE